MTGSFLHRAWSGGQARATEERSAVQLAVIEVHQQSPVNSLLSSFCLSSFAVGLRYLQ